MERFCKPTLKSHASSAPPNPGRQKTLSWRQKHEDFIQTVRMARQLSDAAKSGKGNEEINGFVGNYSDVGVVTINKV